MCQNMKELSKIANEIFELEQKKAKKRKEMDELEIRIKELKSETATYMKKRQKKELDVDSFTVLFTAYSRSQFDSKAFIANEQGGKELYDKYCKPVQMQRVTVRVTKGGVV